MAEKTLKVTAAQIEESVEKSHNHSNLSTLNNITSSRMSEWDDKADKEHRHNASEIDGIENLDVDLSNYYTKTQVDNKIATEMDSIDLSSYAKKSEIPNATSDLTNDSNFATQSFVTNKIAEAQLDSGNVDLSGYATKDELNAKANISAIPTKTSQLTNDSGYLTAIPEEYIPETELTDKGYLTSHQDISGLQPKTDNNLATTSKKVVGAINEVKDKVDLKANNSEVVKKTDITDTIDINSSDIKIPNVKAIYNDIIEGKIIDQTVIDTYGTEILKYPLGKWRISDDSLVKKFSDLPVKTSGRIEITSIVADINKNPWNDSWAYRTYNFETYSEMNFFRKLSSVDTAGVKHDTGWRRVCTTTVADVPNTVIVSEDIIVNLNSNCYYTVINGVCYVTLWGFTCTGAGQYVVNSSMPKTKLTMKGVCTYGSSGYVGGCAYVLHDGKGNNKLYIEVKSTNEPLYGTFSYPVA